MASTSKAELVRTAFRDWERGSNRAFFALVAADVTWRVIGSTPLSGTYEDRKTFLAATAPLVGALAEPIMATVLAVHDAGDTVVLQWHGSSRGVNGRPYEQDYCWVIGFRGDEIVDVTAYLDTALINDIIGA